MRSQDPTLLRTWPSNPCPPKRPWRHTQRRARHRSQSQSHRMHLFCPREPARAVLAVPPAPHPPYFLYPSLQGVRHVPTSPRKQRSAVRGSMLLAATRPQLRVPSTPGDRDKGRQPRCRLGGPIRVGAAHWAEVAVSAGSCSSLPSWRASGDSGPAPHRGHLPPTRLSLLPHATRVRVQNVSTCKTRPYVHVSKCKTCVHVFDVQNVSSCWNSLPSILCIDRARQSSIYKTGFCWSWHTLYFFHLSREAIHFKLLTCISKTRTTPTSLSESHGRNEEPASEWLQWTIE